MCCEQQETWDCEKCDFDEIYFSKNNHGLNDIIFGYKDYYQRFLEKKNVILYYLQHLFNIGIRNIEL